MIRSHNNYSASVRGSRTVAADAAKETVLTCEMDQSIQTWTLEECTLLFDFLLLLLRESAW